MLNLLIMIYNIKTCLLNQPWNDCIINIGDSLLVSIGKKKNLKCRCKISIWFADILLLLRSLVHEGTPLDTVAVAVFRDICLRCDDANDLTETQKDWICRLLKIGIIILS